MHTNVTRHADYTEGVHPTDDKNGFFAKGRDFESRYVNHQYTEQEKEFLASYESVDYLPPHSHVYLNWLRQQPKRLDWDRWVMMGLIGFSTGLVGFLLHQMISLISSFKWDYTQEYLTHSGKAVAWLWAVSISLLLVIFGSAIVVILRPSAAGSGLPELIGFLNGTLVRHIFNVKTLAVKFVSCICAVASGLPVGPEGPMIHMGSLIGAGMSQFKSDTMSFDIPFFQRFRNPEDRRNFISAGAAAGVASAFGAPVGGLLFAMEEVSSFWSMKLSWQVFFCCMISTFTTDLFNSAFHNFKYQGDFGLFRSQNYIIFKVMDSLDVNIIMFIPTVVLGVVGGLLGGMFVFINLKLARLRQAFISKTSKKWKKKSLKIMEPCLIIILFSTASVLLPAAFSCSPFTCYPNDDNLPPEMFSPRCLTEKVDSVTEASVSLYTCPLGETRYENGSIVYSNKSFNQVASLLFLSGEEAIQHLFSRGTHWEFSYIPLVTVLLLYFSMACWSCGPHISAGLVVPMLYIGALYGRIIGVILVSMFGVKTVETDPYWAWMDPGAFALIGAASFFGGVSRLTMSLTVIMMEITNDIQFLLPIMVAIMIAKWIGDFITHPLYHALLEVKCIPFLDSEPVIVHEGQNVAGGNAKSTTQCKDRYRNLVQAITKRRWQVQATGGGAAPPPLTRAQVIIEGSLASVKLEGIDCPVDTFSFKAAEPEAAGNKPEASACYVLDNLDSVYSMPVTIEIDDTPTQPITPSLAVTRPPAKRKYKVTVEEYMERKLAVLEKEHVLKCRMLVAQAKYYEALFEKM